MNLEDRIQSSFIMCQPAHRHGLLWFGKGVLHNFSIILSRVGWYALRKWQVLVWTVAVISTSVSHCLLITPKYRQYSTVSDLHTFQFTVAHALGLTVFTSRLLAMDLNTETIAVSLDHTIQILNINKVLKSQVKSSQADLLYSSVLLVPIALFACFRCCYLYFCQHCSLLQFLEHGCNRVLFTDHL
jgi:hypothetical protein